MARTANDVQTGVRLPAELYKRLQESAGAGPVSEEIRRRLAESFASAGPAVDAPQFHDIMAAIGQAASATAGSTNAYGDFAAAVPFLLALFQPEGGYVEEGWVAMVIASAALTTMGRTDLLPRLKEIAGREFDSSGESRPRNPVLYPQDYGEGKP
jgi:hypothetical protein